MQKAERIFPLRPDNQRNIAHMHFILHMGDIL